MARKNILVIAVATAFGLALLLTLVSVQAAAHGTLKVTLSYTGAGVVDEKHQIYVLLTDANPFVASKLVDSTAQATAPAPAAGVSHILACEGAAGKDATVSFRDLTLSPVYAIAFFDKNGAFDGHPDSLPAHVPIGVYGKLPDKVEPVKVEEGKTTQIVLAFNDSALAP